MKKILLLIAFSLLAQKAYSATVTNQNLSERITMQELMEGETFEQVFPFLNMKVFHDRDSMKEIVNHAYQNEISPSSVEDGKGMTDAFLNNSDTKKLDDAYTSRNMEYGLKQKSLDENLQDVEKNPFAVFQRMMIFSSVPKTSKKEMDNLNKIDKKAIPERIQLITEGGSDVGAEPISVIYNKD